MRSLLFAILAFTPAYAATLTGTVTDRSGQPIPGARITIFARDGRDRTTSVADERGRYRIASIPSGEYLVEAAAAGMAPAAAKPVTAGDSATLDLVLDLAAVRTEVLVTATGSAQSTDEIAKSVDSLRAADLEKNSEFSVTEALRSLPGMRIQTLGGPGASTRIVTRGLRPQDTAITIDGLRFRDAATTQGDATPFLQDLVLLGADRIEVLRGTGSSIYGSNAIGGVVNLVTDTGGGAPHGEIKAEGGGLGMMRGLARLGGGTRSGRFGYSAGLQSTDVLSGIDGTDAFRNHSMQGSLQFRPAAGASLTAYFWATDSFAQLNSTPYAAPAASLPARGIIEAIPVSLDVQHLIEKGLPFSYSGANFVPQLNDPDYRRSSRFLSGALVYNQRLNRIASARVSYHKVITQRHIDDGPAGVRFPPAWSVTDHIRGGTDTVEARLNFEPVHWNVFSFGYEFERESFRTRHLEFPPAPANRGYFAAAGQNDNSFFFSDQLRLLHDRLQIGLSGRLQRFDVRTPEFAGGISRYQGLSFPAPSDAKTGDVAAAYFFPLSATKLRAHMGNGYRAPAIFERLGTGFDTGVFTSYGNPNLRPERTVAVDAGLDQYLLRQRLRVSGTWFYTNLQETIAFDSSGFLVPSADPYGRSTGYINTAGGIARGTELSAEAVPFLSLKLNLAYTYTNADLRRSTVRDRDFFQIPFTSPHQFTVVATQRIGRRIDVIADFWAASESPAIFSSRAFLFAGPRKLDLAGNYTIPLSDHTRMRFYAKINNILDWTYFEGGYRVPGIWGTGGVSLEFE
jgi:iron complex outermembrane receptor protein